MPAEWWEAAEVIFATSSFDDGKYAEAIKAYRKSRIGRGNPLRAKDFDNAASGAVKAMAGKPESIADQLTRSRWYAQNGIVPAIVRPIGWDWRPEELTAIRIIRTTVEPKFLAYDTAGIVEVSGPSTKPNPWDKWRL